MTAVESPRPSGILRRVVPSLGDSLGPEPGRAWGPVGWFIGLRWLAFLALSAAVLATTIVEERVAATDATALWVGIGLLAAFNASLLLVSPARLSRTGALLIQVGFDVGLLGILLHHAGGITNPFAGLFVFHAVVAAVVLDARRAAWVAVAIAGFVIGLTGLEAAGVLHPGCVRGIAGSCDPEVAPLRVGAAGLATSVLVLGASFLVVPLVRILREDRTRLTHAMQELSDNAERLDAARGEVQAEREKLQTIIDCMADAVLFADPEGNLRLRNRAAAALWEGQAAPSAEALRVCHTPDVWARLLEKVANPDPVEAHPLLRVGPRAFEASYAAVAEPDGRTRGVVMVARDVTDRIEAQEKQVEQERMAVVGKLAAGLAHEINNPLGAMVLFTQHALKGLAPEAPLAEHLRTVLRNANHCKKIVKDLLDYARQRPPEWTVVAVDELLGDVVRTLRPQAEHCRVQITCAAECGDCRLEGDPGQLRQVLVNLGLNAIEAMPQGGRLSLSARRDEDHVAIEVADTGSGIAPEDEARIFSAFFTTKVGGTGLGLAVARDLVAAHGGVLSFRTAQGEGTTFTARLPVTRAHREETT